MSERDEMVALRDLLNRADSVVSLLVNRHRYELRGVGAWDALVQVGDDLREWTDRRGKYGSTLAAGWSRPRVVTNVEELDALPNQAVVVDGGDYHGPARQTFVTAFQKDGDDWWVAGGDVSCVPSDILAHGPAAVVWSPPVESGETQGGES